jgi:hypothetical protein
MLFPRIGRHFLVHYCVLTLLSAGIPAFVAAQESAESVVRVPQQIILPPKVVAGVAATLAVVDASGLLVPKVTVELSGGQRVITDATGRATFNAPRNFGMMVAQLAAPSITAYSFVLAPPAAGASASASASTASVRILSYPRFISKSDKFTVEGTGFRGDPDTNRVFLGEQQCFVLASSPASLVVFPGAHAAAGATSLSVTIAGKGSVSIPVSVVELDLGDSAAGANAGDHENLAVRVRGTQNPMTLQIVNKSPDIVQFSQGPVQQVETSGGENNLAQVMMRGVKEGDYVVAAHLLTTVSGAPDIESARQELVAARLSATGKWAERIDSLLKRFDKKSPNVAKIRDDLGKLLRDKPSAEMSLLLNAAMQDLTRS